jgi:hypothetical protein
VIWPVRASRIREIAPFLTRFFQSALNNGDVPKDWKYANVTAIFRKGGRFLYHTAYTGQGKGSIIACLESASFPENCSNVSILPIFWDITIVECALEESNNILKHLDRNIILTDCQHGFRARRSCDTQLLSLKHELAISLESGIQQDLFILYFLKLVLISLFVIHRNPGPFLTLCR